VPPGYNVAGRRARREIDRCVLIMRQGKRWQSREIKFKELKHKGGHIALGK
jgi:hypothetical protein